jgi:hypothetical protein
MCTARIGAAHPMAKNPSPYGTFMPIGEGALGTATIEAG